MLHCIIDNQRLKSFFPGSFYDRGEEYYQQGRVHHLEVANQSFNHVRLIASVIGSKPYDLNIEVWGGSSHFRVHGICSCPMGVNCKHVVAVLLKASDQLPVAAPPTNNHADVKVVPFPNPVQAPNIKRWLEELKHSFNEVEKTIDKTYGLLYLLSYSSERTTQIQLKLNLFRRLRAGGYGGSKAFSSTNRFHERHLEPIDQELILKLEIAKNLSSKRRASNDYLLDNEMAEKLLAELLGTKRCHWSSANNPPLSLGPIKKAEPVWEVDDQGSQELKFFAKDAAIFVFAIDNLWFLDKKNWVLGPIETGLNKKMAKLLLSAPKIPPEATKEVATLLIQHKKTQVQAPKVFTKTTIEKNKAIPCLRLFQASLFIPGGYKNDWEPIPISRAIAALSFDYGAIQLSWEDKREVISQLKGDELIRVVRNKDEEKEARDQLIQHHLLLIESVPEFEELNDRFLYHFLIEHPGSDPLSFTEHGLPELRAKGWHIDIAEDYGYQIIDEPIDDWYSSIEESSGYDWFGLELGITVKGEKINLLPVLQSLLRKLQTHSEVDKITSESVLARLSNGRHIKLPAARVQHILNVLVELYDHDSLSDDQKLHLSRLHALRLLELEAGLGAAQLRWFGGENIRKLAEKLSQFKGIEVVDVPKEFQGELRTYQLEGLSWLQFLREYELNGLLADDMGLGKTVQTLAHISLEKTSGRMTIPSLVVAPTSLMFNWHTESNRFAPHLKVLVLHGPQRKQHFENIANYDLILTTYPLLVRDKEFLLEQSFYFLILDEAQFIKNTKGLGTQIAHQLKAKHRLCLTGTPMENHLGELWSLFNFMMPGLLGEEKRFNRLFRIPIEKHADQERRAQLNRRIAPFLLRRTKEKVVQELPEKIETIRYVELKGAQRDIYETIRVTMQEKIQREIAKLGFARSYIIILEGLLKLRQACCDPRLLKMEIDKKHLAKSAKLELLIDLVQELLNEGKRILLFSQFTSMLSLIEAELKKKKISYVKLCGETQDRQTPIRQFQEGKVPLFLISLKAGGTGLNLTAADAVIHYDPWWNPAVESQATNRAHRIGQSKTVFVYKLIVKGTIEEKMLEMQDRKRALMEGLFSNQTTGKLQLTEKDLQVLFEA